MYSGVLDDSAGRRELRSDEQPAQLRDRHWRRLIHLRVLVHEPGESDRRPLASWPEPVEHLAQRPLRLRPRREPTHLRFLRAATFEPVPVCPQRLAIRTLRLQLERLPLLDHHEPPRSEKEIDESRAYPLPAREGAWADTTPKRPR